MFKNLVDRFIKYVEFETRSNPDSDKLPSTQSQLDFAKVLIEDLEEIGMDQAYFHKESGAVMASLKSNTDKKLPTIGFLAHMDTADFNAENVKAQIIKDYDGLSDIILDPASKYSLNIRDFPNLKNYKGCNLITTDGSSLLGADDKAGIAEIVTAMEYLIENPEIKHGPIKIAFTPDEEIGTGANYFDVEEFGADFAYTLDGGPLGELNYENFNAASAHVKILGKNVHPGSAKNIMINALKLMMEFDSLLPQDQLPENTEMYQGFFLIEEMSGTIEEAKASYIIRDHSMEEFEKKKQLLLNIKDRLNEKYSAEIVTVHMEDSYYNMGEILEDNIHIVKLAREAMENVDIIPNIVPIRGGTDGARLSFKGLPTPNIFAGGENMHGRYEFVAIETMEKAVETILEIINLSLAL